jgi:hypothetical protein
MCKTSRKDEIMIRTSKGLFFAIILHEKNRINLILDDEIFFEHEWIRAAVEASPDKFVVCIMGDNNFYVVDRLLNLV